MASNNDKQQQPQPQLMPIDLTKNSTDYKMKYSSLNENQQQHHSTISSTTTANTITTINAASNNNNNHIRSGQKLESTAAAGETSEFDNSNDKLVFMNLNSQQKSLKCAAPNAGHVENLSPIKPSFVKYTLSSLFFFSLSHFLRRLVNFIFCLFVCYFNNQKVREKKQTFSIVT
jgi:hypothetical protein